MMPIGHIYVVTHYTLHTSPYVASPTVNSLKELQVPSPFSNSIFATRGRTVSRMLKVAVLQIMNFYENVFKSNKPGEKKDFLVQIPYFPGLMMSMLMTIFSNSSFGHKNVACSSILKYAFLYEHR